VDSVHTVILTDRLDVTGPTSAPASGARSLPPKNRLRRCWRSSMLITGRTAGRVGT